ncbi:MAG: InlB B-repeat-containing protein [Clostridia bacterium]|nr:InlB B-repeat-containing protein [Clostridia bacterium]
MKKSLLRFFALLLTLTVSVSVFVGCGGGDDNGGGHTHTFSEEWAHDETHHWHESTCGHEDAVVKVAHTYGEIIVDEPATPTKKGYGHKTCSGCGITKYNIEVEFVVDPNADVTLVFDVRGGQAIDPVTVKAGTTIDLTQYTVEREELDGISFEGWVVGGKKVESIELVGDMVAHASYSCDEYLGKQSIKLGRYPQTRVTDQSIIDALDQMEMSDRNLDGYYEYQGEEYAKEVCLFDSSFGYEKFQAYYFKVEPITWVGSNGRWTTSQIIDFMDETTYAQSVLEYLNGDFYNSLTDAEKAVIGDKNLNEENPYKFYLWNVDNFVSSHSSQADRKLPLTDYALCKDDTEFYKEDRFTTKYWLLNPINSSGIDTVSFYNIDKNGNYEIDATYMERAGLLPCVTFDFQGVEKMTGDDTIRVTFNSNGGSEIATKTLIAGEKYDLDTPEKEGFNFVGWYKDEQLTQSISAYNFSSTKNMTLYAKWEVKPEEPDVYNVVYELNGGAFDSSITLDKEFLEGEVITFPIPKKDSTISYDYKFDGWYLEEDFQTKITSTEGLVENVKVYAKWKEEGKYFYIEYNLSYGESIVEEDYPIKVLCAEGTIDLPTAQYNGYVFLGWKQRGYEELITTLSTNRLPNSGAVELTPYWTRAYEITWNLNGATLENEDQLPDMIYSGCPTIDFTQFVPQKDGYKFMYWSVSWLTAGNKYGVGHTETLSFTDGFNLPTTSSEPYISAVFTQVHTLKLDLSGGNVDGNTDIVEIEFGYSQGDVTFQNPVKDGATLLGWSGDYTCAYEATYYDMKYYADKILFTVNADGTTTFNSRNAIVSDYSTGEDELRFDTIYAIWDKITVSFETGVDGVTLDPVTIGYKESINFDDVAYSLGVVNDKKFGGWYRDEELSYKFTSTYFYKDVTVYAKWLSKLTITIVYEDGTTDEQYIYESETIDSITFEIGDGQYFGGAYFDAELTNKLSNSQLSNYKPKGDMTLYVVRKSL